MTSLTDDVDEVFGSWQDWDNNFALREQQSCLGEDGCEDLWQMAKQCYLDMSTPAGVVAESMVTLNDIVNLDALKDHAK
eukprot:5279835-Karenia_brevis.AAC.1